MFGSVRRAAYFDVISCRLVFFLCEYRSHINLKVKSRLLLFREKLFNKVLAHLPINDDHKKVVRRARHRYERPSALQAEMNAKHKHSMNFTR